MTGTSAANLRGCLRTGLGCTDQLDLSWLCGVFLGTKKKSAAWADSVRSQKSGLGVSACSQLSPLPIGRGFYVVLCAGALIRGLVWDTMYFHPERCLLGSWVWGWELEGAERTTGLYSGYFALMFINASPQWTALYCIYIMT